MNKMSALQWAEEMAGAPVEFPSLEELPDSYLWRQPLIHLNANFDVRDLGLPRFHGAVFSGPAGNGKHTLAKALLTTLQNRYDISRDRVIQFWLTAEDFPEELDIEDAVDRIETLFDVINEPANYEFCEDTRFGILVFDQMELYHRAQLLVNTIAQQAEDLPAESGIVVCITEDDSIVTSQLRQALLPCRCTLPGPRQRQKILEQGLHWMTAFDQKVTMNLLGVTLDELTRRTEGLSCGEICTLLLMLRAEIVSSNFSETQPNVQLSLQPDLVLDVLDMFCRPVSVPALAAVIPAPASNAAPTVISAPPAAASAQKEPIEMSAREYIDYVVNLSTD